MPKDKQFSANETPRGIRSRTRHIQVFPNHDGALHNVYLQREAVLLDGQGQAMGTTLPEDPMGMTLKGDTEVKRSNGSTVTLDQIIADLELVADVVATKTSEARAVQLEEMRKAEDARRKAAEEAKQ